jgi:hypothetical protein
MEYDKNNNSCFWREYMRLRIKMDVRVPLKKGTRVKDRNGNWCTVRFKYEKLGIFCFVCGIMGHAENRCETRFAMEVDDGNREWSNDLRAEPRRVAGRPKSRWLVEERGGSRKEGGRVNNGRSQSSGESSNQDPTVFNAPTNAFNDIIIASQNGQDNPLNPSLTSVGQPLCPKNTQSLPNNEMIMTNPAVTSTVSPIPAFKPPFSQNLFPPNITFTASAMSHSKPDVSTSKHVRSLKGPISIDPPSVKSIANHYQSLNQPIHVIQPAKILTPHNNPTSQNKPVFPVSKISQPILLQKNDQRNYNNIQTFQPIPVSQPPLVGQKISVPLPFPVTVNDEPEDADNMDVQAERKRRREEETKKSVTNDEGNQHFLSAGPGIQDCREQ